MRTVKRLVTCDLCGVTVPDGEALRSGQEWMEMRFCSYGNTAAMYVPAFDLCPHCNERVGRALQIIKKGADLCGETGEGSLCDQDPTV